MNNTDLDAIRRRIDSATDGPWEVSGQRVVRRHPDFPGPGGAEVVEPILSDAGESAANLALAAHAREDVPALLDEVERLQTLLSDAGVRYTGPSADAEFQAEKKVGFQEFLHAQRAEADRDDLEERLSLLLWDLTGGKLSKPGYDVRTMVSEVEATFERYAEMDRAELQAERDRLAAEVERLREYIDRMPYPSDMDELRAERDRLAATVDQLRELMGRMHEFAHTTGPCGHGCSGCVTARWEHDLRAAIEGTDS